jgi:hypothetical protein
MDLTLIRSSTLRITFGELRLLFDPYLAPKGGGRSYGGVHTSPLSDLPYTIETILADIDAVLVSHLHSDHFDDVARERLPREVPVLCHERDKAEISKWGFSHVKGFDQPTVWRWDAEGLQACRGATERPGCSLGEEAWALVLRRQEPRDSRSSARGRAPLSGQRCERA